MCCCGQILKYQYFRKISIFLIPISWIKFIIKKGFACAACIEGACALMPSCFFIVFLSSLFWLFRLNDFIINIQMLTVRISVKYTIFFSQNEYESGELNTHMFARAIDNSCNPNKDYLDFKSNHLDFLIKIGKNRNHSQWARDFREDFYRSQKSFLMFHTRSIWIYSLI